MKAYLALFALVLTPLLGAAEPTAPKTLREVLAVEAPWTVAFPDVRKNPMAHTPPPALQPARALLTRVVEARSDTDRALAVRILKTNWATFERIVITPALSLDTREAKPGEALWIALRRVVDSGTLTSADQTEIKRLLDSVR